MSAPSVISGISGDAIVSEATIDDAFEVAQLMIEEGNTEHGVQLLRAAEIALVRAEGDRPSVL